jgi:hypothetical protein
VIAVSLRAKVFLASRRIGSLCAATSAVPIELKLRQLFFALLFYKSDKLAEFGLK